MKIPACHSAKAGVTIIELMVVMLIVVALILGFGPSASNALMLEQNYREEAAVRCAIAEHLARAEKMISLAKSFHPATHTLSMPLETAGVSLETGSWIRVESSLLNTWTNASTNIARPSFTFVTGDPRRPGTHGISLSAFGMPGVNRSGELIGQEAIVVTNQLHTTSVPGIYRYEVSSLLLYRMKIEGEWVEVRTNISASRFIRAWNE